jgi:hypothetical protein
MQQLQQIAQTPLQPVPQAGPDQGASPVKRFLTNFFYGAGQSALQHVGLPTDYEKQQNVIQQNQRQQQLNQQAGETSSLIGLHQQQLQNEQQTYAQNQYQNQQLPIPAEVAEHFPGQTTARRADIIPMLQAGISANQKEPQQVPDEIADMFHMPHGTKVSPIMLPVLSKIAGMQAGAKSIKDAGGFLQVVNKYTGESEPVVGPNGKPVQSNSTITPQLRAYWMARYGVANVMDNAGNPTAVSKLTQLQTGAPSMTEGQTMTLQGDKVGVDTYLGASDRVEKGVRSGVMKDPVQRGLIAHATEDIEKNPGAIDSVLSSYAQQGLSPQGADMIAALRQMGEFGPVFKKFSGNGGRSSDALNATVKSNQPSTANSDATNLDLIAQDRKLAQQIKVQLQRPGAYAPAARQPNAPTPQAGAPAPANGFSWSQFGGQQR